MAHLSDLDIVRDFDRRIAGLQNALDVRNVSQIYELRLIQQTISDLHKRLDRIEERLDRPSRTDTIMEALKAIPDRMWFKIAALGLLVTGNQQALEFLKGVWR